MNHSSHDSLPRSYEKDIYPWHVGKVADIIVDGRSLTHPVRKHAIFVVHGIGNQQLTETAATLRSGFEDALEEIYNWQKTQGINPVLGDFRRVPPPFIKEGFWADYDNLQTTFPEEWKVLEAGKQEFFSRLWRMRALSSTRAFAWFLRQQLRLLHPKVIFEISLFAWLLYFPLQILSLTGLVLVRIFFPGVVSRVLADVRLYLAPKGITERAIVQRIDYRVGADFLRMIGLNWDFLPLSKSDLAKVQGEPVIFERVVWVAHSLGTVISYNVLSDLFSRAEELQTRGTSKQKEGVRRFREALSRFVTLGSPLDKVAYLFGTGSLRPWPKGDREKLVNHGDTIQQNGRKEWWVNFFHVLDPVSGALSSSLICGKRAPINVSIGPFGIPGVAHLAYWTDSTTLRYILSRVFGRRFMPDKEYGSTRAGFSTFSALIGYVAWTLIIVGVPVLIVWGLVELIRGVF